MNDRFLDIEQYNGKIPMEVIIDLARKKDAGDFEARQKLITSHLWLVKMIARQRASFLDNEYQRKELEMDLYQEGCLGLIVAVDRYNWQQEVHLSTYAVTWIRRYISKYFVDVLPHIKVTERIYYLIYKYRNFLMSFKIEHDRMPSFEECVENLGVSASVMKSVIKYNPLLYNNYDSTEMYLRFDDDFPGENIVIVSEEDVYREIESSELLDFNVKLDPREEKIICLRIGFNDNYPLSFREIGEKLDITGERARQIYNTAIGKLKEAANKTASN